jgi:hypothetical protein
MAVIAMRPITMAVPVTAAAHIDANARDANDDAGSIAGAITAAMIGAGVMMIARAGNTDPDADADTRIRGRRRR